MNNKLLVSFIFMTTLLNAQVNEQFNRESLKKVLTTIENNYNLKIAYDPQLIKNTFVTTTLKNKSYEQSFQTILYNTQLSYERVNDDYYLIKPSDKKWSFKGEIVDDLANKVPYSKLYIIGTSSVVYADKNGNYSLNYLSDYDPLIEITCLGYKPKVVLGSVLLQTPNLILNQDVKEFNTVVVEYLTKGVTTTYDISKITINPQKIGPVPGSTELDIFQLIQNFPGINSANSSVSEIQIRGGTADQNHLIWDGIPIYHPDHFNGMFSTINPNIIDKTDIYKDVYDPYYGGKTSGLIELKSINHIPNKLEYGVSANLIQADSYVKAPITKKSAILISARRSYMDIWKSPTYLRYADRVYQQTEILNINNVKDKPTFFAKGNNTNALWNQFLYYDFNGKYIYKPNNKSLLTISGLFTLNKLQYTFLPDTSVNLENGSYINSTNFGLSSKYKRIWNPKWKSDFSISLAQYDYSLENEYGYFKADNSIGIESIYKSNSVKHYSTHWSNDIKINKSSKIKTGLEFTYLSVDHSLNFNDVKDSVSEVGSNKGFTPAIHFNYIYQKNKILFKAGSRLSYLNTTNDLYFEPRLYGQYKLNSYLTIKSAFGIQFQPISQVDQFGATNIGLPTRIWVMANAEEISTLKSQVFNTGLRFLYKGWHIEADLFIKQINNIVNFSENTSLSSGLLRGDAYARGFDILIKKRWKRYRTWLTYTFNDILYDFKNYSTNEFQASFNQPHIFKWINTLQWEQFEIATSFKIASGKPYTPAVGVKSISELNLQTGNVEIIDNVLTYGTINSVDLPIFHQLDISIFYNFPKSTSQKWRGQIGLSALNVYNKLNILNRYYSITNIGKDLNGNEQYKTSTIDKYYLKFTPNLMVKFKF